MLALFVKFLFFFNLKTAYAMLRILVGPECRIIVFKQKTAYEIGVRLVGSAGKGKEPCGG